MKMLFHKIADNTNPSSLAAHMRRKRFQLFNQFLSSIKADDIIKIIDLGGDPKYWINLVDMIDVPVSVSPLNRITYPESGDSRINLIVGDARDLSRFKDQSFDVVYSNSLIEHIGSYRDQKRLADEIRRIGRAYFVQTPNRYFPIEPHFLIPFYQFFPKTIQLFIANNFQPGWFKYRNREIAVEAAKTIRLLSRNEIRNLFPEGNIWSERISGMVKSYIVYKRF